MVIFSGGMTPIKSMPDSGYIDAYRISMLMPTRWGLEELLREYDSYGDGYPIGSREPIKMRCEDFNETLYPDYICEYDYMPYIEGI